MKIPSDESPKQQHVEADAINQTCERLKAAIDAMEAGFRRDGLATSDHALVQKAVTMAVITKLLESLSLSRYMKIQLIRNWLGVDAPEVEILAEFVGDDEEDGEPEADHDQNFTAERAAYCRSILNNIYLAIRQAAMDHQRHVQEALAKWKSEDRIVDRYALRNEYCELCESAVGGLITHLGETWGKYPMIACLETLKGQVIALDVLQSYGVVDEDE